VPVTFYFFHKGVVYKKATALPILEVASSGDDCGYSSYDNAQSVLQECQDAQSKNTLGFETCTLIGQGRILDNVEILPSNHLALYSFLNS